MSTSLYDPVHSALAQGDADVAWLAEKAERIRLRGQRITADIIAIGQDLIEVRERLPDSDWSDWLDREFDWSQPTASRFMAAAKAFGSVFTVNNGTRNDLQIDASALYLLAAPKVPAAVREEAVERAGDGERITKAEAWKMIEEAEQLAVERAARRVQELEANYAALAQQLEDIEAEGDDLQMVDPLAVLAQMLGKEPDKAKFSPRQVQGLAAALGRPIEYRDKIYPPVTEAESRDAERRLQASMKLHEAVSTILTLGDPGEMRLDMHQSVRATTVRAVPDVISWLEYFLREEED